MNTGEGIYTPKPFEEWHIVPMQGWTRETAHIHNYAVLFSETGHTGDNMFHAYVLCFNEDGTRKEFKEVVGECEKIYNNQKTNTVRQQL